MRSQAQGQTGLLEALMEAATGGSRCACTHLGNTGMSVGLARKVITGGCHLLGVFCTWAHAEDRPHPGHSVLRASWWLRW